MPESTLNLPRGYFSLPWGVIEIGGGDAADFLNRMSTLDFKRWDASRTRLGAFLTGRSGLISLGFFQSAGKGFHYILPSEQLPAVVAHLEQFHFAEDLTYEDVSAGFSIFASEAAEASAGQTWPDPMVPSLKWVKIPRAQEESVLAAWQKLGLPELGAAWWDFARTASGIPQVGGEVDSQVMILEAGLELAVDRNKGCYPGQEVVERIFTYGQVNRKLMPVRLTGSWRGKSWPLKFMQADKPAAMLVSGVERPGEPGVAVGLAFIYRSFWETTEIFQTDNVGIQILR